jgi:NAD+ diphosphatase
MVIKERMQFYPSVTPPDSFDEALWFLFNGSSLVVSEDKTGVHIPCFSDPVKSGLSVKSQIYLGTIDSVHCFCGELLSAVPENYGFELKELRALFDQLNPALYNVAAKASQIISWDRNHQFCGACGSQTDSVNHEYAKKCRECGMLFYPRISPAIIVAIIHDGKILLGRRRSSQMFSLIAGYVEAGESLEETVSREVMEEVSLRVKNVKYFSSQPWAFSNALMVGFTAEYDGGEIKPDGEEIAEAKWFSADSIPKIPGKISIARKLIDWFIGEYSEPRP